MKKELEKTFMYTAQCKKLITKAEKKLCKEFDYHAF